MQRFDFFHKLQVKKTHVWKLTSFWQPLQLTLGYLSHAKVNPVVVTFDIFAPVIGVGVEPCVEHTAVVDGLAQSSWWSDDSRSNSAVNVYCVPGDSLFPAKIGEEGHTKCGCMVIMRFTLKHFL